MKTAEINIFEEKPAFLIFSVIAVLLLPLLHSFGFIADDYWLLHAALNNPLPMTTDWVGSDVNMFRPVVVFSMYLNYLIAGYRPFGFYAVNLLLHLLNTILLYKTLKELSAGSDFSLSPKTIFVISLLFLALPQNLINVYWISGRTDILCGTFVFTALYFFVLFLASRSTKHLIYCLLAQFAAYGSKETAFILIFYLALILVAKGELKRNNATLNRWLPVVFSPAILYVLYRLFIFRGNAMGDVLSNNFSVSGLIKFFSYGFWILTIPFDILDVYYFYCTNRLILLLIGFSVFALLACALFLVIKNRKNAKMKTIAACVLFIIAGLAIYIRSFPEMRLGYVFHPVVLTLIVTIYSLADFKFMKWFTAALFVVLFLAGNALIIHRTFTINNYYSRLSASLPNAIDSSKSYYILTPIGRYGQSAAAPQLGLMTYYKIHGNMDERPLNFHAAGLYEGFSLSKEPPQITVTSLSPYHFYLTVNNPTDGIVPIASKKFNEAGEYRYEEMTMKMIRKRMFRPGVAESCEIIITDSPKNQVILVH
jgi:hypothetical protein